MSRRTRAAVALVAATACVGPPDLPHVEGRGIVAEDVVVPAGVPIAERPSWAVGTRFAYRRGDLVGMAFRVVDADDAGYVLEEETSGLRNTFTRELALVGQQVPDDASLDRLVDPFDASLRWPLWPGKHWVCHYVRRGGPVDVPMVVRYACDAVESVTTPAGTFDAFRIWRRARPATDGAFFDRCDLLWYAPDVGFFVRKLEDGVLTELEGAGLGT